MSMRLCPIQQVLANLVSLPRTVGGMLSSLHYIHCNGFRSHDDRPNTNIRICKLLQPPKKKGSTIVLTGFPLTTCCEPVTKHSTSTKWKHQCYSIRRRIFNRKKFNQNIVFLKETISWQTLWIKSIDVDFFSLILYIVWLIIVKVCKSWIFFLLTKYDYYSRTVGVI